MIKFTLLIFICTLFVHHAPAQKSPPGAHLYDGPYLFFDRGALLAKWISAGKMYEDTLRPGKPLQMDARVSASFDANFVDAGAAFVRSPVTAFKNVEQIAVVGDPHGQYKIVRQLLQTHHIMDENQNWTFGKGHLVILGDVFDRGDEVTDIFWLILKLEKQAAAAGGMVHFLLGNHEIMTLENDLRYLHKKYRFTTALMGIPYPALYGPDTYLGRWLRTKPVAFSINNIMFVHAGFSESILQMNLSLAQMNTAFQERIVGRPENEILSDPVAAALYLENGPLWYRGYFEPGFSREQILQILNRLKAKHIVVGHTSFPEIKALHRKKIIAADSSIKTGESGEILLISKKQFFRGDLAGNKFPLK